MSSDTNAPGDGPSLLFEHAVKFMQGRRTVQEDRHVIIDPLEVYIQQSVPQASQFTFPTSLKPALLMGLFDGHSGAQASTFCVQRLPLEIAKEFSALPWTERVHVPVCSTEVDTAPPEQSKTVPLSIMSPPTINQTVTLAPSLDSTDKGNPEVRLQDCRPSTDASLEGTHQKRLRTDSASETPTTELDKRQKLCESSSSAASTAPCTTISESTFEASEAQSKASITVETIAAAIRRAFITTDRLFLEKYRLNKDGSTASLVIILGPHVFIAWLGDSGVILGSERTLSFHSPTPRSQKTFFPLLSIGIHAEEFSSPQVPPDKALLSRSAAATDGGAIKLWKSSFLSEDHKPSRIDERLRIERSGGLVIVVGDVARVARGDFLEECRRLKQTSCAYGASSRRPPVALAVSRGFGDRELKTPGKPPLVSSVPDIRYFTLDTMKDKVIALACDGIWDVLKPQDVVTVLQQSLTNNVRTLTEREGNGNSSTGVEEGTSQVVKLAFQKGSQDNLTLIAARIISEAPSNPVNTEKAE